MQKKLWGDVLAKLEKRINRPSFNTWLRPTRCVSMEHKHVRIGVPDEIFVYWLGEHYVNMIVETLTEFLGFQPNISFMVMVTAEGNNRAENTQNAPTPIMLPQTQAPDRASVAQNEPCVSQPPGRSSQYPKPSGGTKKPSRALPLNQIILNRANGSRGRDEVTSSPPLAFQAKAQSMPIVPPPHAMIRSLNPVYTFESYVVGNNNRLANAAALAVADQMAVNYNPLFIYGGVGLGKTHLLHAIGNHVLKHHSITRILYLSAEQFINELVCSIREDRMAKFREKYRNIDLFLVDDIQFIARKERTQEEFFHTFNTLYQARKQIVLTSDCPPKKIPTIAEQLRSRFEWGLIADIQPPDLETRVAILKKKAEVQQINLPDEVALYIASKVRSNIRELEGCLAKMRAYSTFTYQALTLELAQKVLQDMFEMTPRKVTVELVQQAVANHYQLELADMRSSSRDRKITLPRQIAMYLTRELTNLSLPDIGRNFGGRDHSTVMHACKKVERSQGQDQQLKESIMQIRHLIQA